MSNKWAEDIAIGKTHVSLELRFSAGATVRHFTTCAPQPANNVRIGGISAQVAPRT